MGWLKKWCHAEKNVMNLTLHVLGNNKSELLNSILIFRLQTFNSEDGSMEWTRCMGGQTMTRSLFLMSKAVNLHSGPGGGSRTLWDRCLKSESKALAAQGVLNIVFSGSLVAISPHQTVLFQVISSQVQMNVPQCGANAVSVLCDNDYTILIRFDTVQLTTEFFHFKCVS